MKHALNNKETKEFLEKIDRFNLHFSKKDHFDRDENIVLINNEPMFFYFQDNLIPTIKALLKENFLKKITVDMGAVKFVAAGADVMRPGITNMQEGIAKDEIVSIVDMAHSKPLAVGQALFSYEDMKSMNSGKVVKSLHYVGDKIWNYP